MDPEYTVILAQTETLMAMAALRDGNKAALIKALDRLAMVLDVRLATETDQEERSAERWYAYAGE